MARQQRQRRVRLRCLRAHRSAPDARGEPRRRRRILLGRLPFDAVLGRSAERHGGRLRGAEDPDRPLASPRYPRGDLRRGLRRRIDAWQSGLTAANSCANRQRDSVLREGMDVMRLPARLLLVSLLCPASLLGVAPGAAAQESHAHADEGVEAAPVAVKTVRWSDPSAWPDGKVPGEGDAVTIARGTEVVRDVDPPALRSLTVDGKLRFAEDRDISLETEWIYLRGGELQIGSEDKPYTRQATITLPDKVPGEDINTMGDRGIMLMRGTL